MECRDFYCLFLLDPNMTESWRPEVAKFVVSTTPDRMVRIFADTERPDAWKREPYYSRLKLWSHDVANGGLVVVSVGKRRIVILPNKDVDLGIIDDYHTISVTRRPTTQGMDYNVVVKPPETANR